MELATVIGLGIFIVAFVVVALVDSVIQHRREKRERAAQAARRQPSPTFYTGPLYNRHGREIG